jgi:hypothetical protein
MRDGDITAGYFGDSNSMRGGGRGEDATGLREGGRVIGDDGVIGFRGKGVVEDEYCVGESEV